MRNISAKELLFNTCKFLIFITFLQSLYAWFFWGQIIKTTILLVTFFCCMLLGLVSHNVFSVKQSNLIPLIIFSIAELYVMKTFGILNIGRALVQICIVSFVFFLVDKHKCYLLDFITKSIALILFFSLIGWIFFLFGIPLPHTIIKHPDFNYWFDNYYIFLSDNKGIIPRFCSIFLEPGHLGMITAFLLYANKFQLRRKEVFIIFIATLFTFSLAAYLLSFIAGVAIIYSNNNQKLTSIILSKKKIFTSLLFLLILVASIFFFKFYKSGENVINKAILTRLEINNGKLKGNDRFSSDFSKFYDEFKKTDQVFLGIGNDFLKMKWQKGNAGWKVFLVQYGILGILLVLSLYLSITLYNLSKYTLIFLFIYGLCFLQAAYPLWLSEVFIFSLSMPKLKKEINIIYDTRFC